MIRKCLLSPLALLLLLIAGPSSAVACARIGSPNPPDDYIVARTDKIYLGTVLEVRDVKARGKHQARRLKLRLDEPIKGNTDQIVYFSFDKPPMTSSCDEPPPDVKVGDNWVIFDGFHEGIDPLSGRVQSFVFYPDQLSFRFDEERDRARLEAIKIFAASPEISLTIEVTKYGLLSSVDPIADARVTIVGAESNRESRTSRNGFCTFNKLHLGRYHVRLTIPFRAKAMVWFNNVETIRDLETNENVFEFEVLLEKPIPEYRYLVLGERR